MASRGGTSPGPGGRGGGGANAGGPGSGRRRKKKGKGGLREGIPRERGNSESSTHKPPVILSKVAGIESNKNQDVEHRSQLSEKGHRPSRPVSPGPQIKIKVRDRDESAHTPVGGTGGQTGGTTVVPPAASPAVPQISHGTNGEQRGRSVAPRLYAPGQRLAGSQMAGISIEVPIHKRLAAPPSMPQVTKLVDSSFQWVEGGAEYLLDQSDYLVIGVLGLQGSGKSTLMSFLAGSEHTDPHSSFMFQPQTSSNREQACHQTTGIEMFVTEERVFLLDTQPVLSSSVLDRLLGQDKQVVPPEYSSAENYAEMQSLHLAAFLLTVCHVVVVIEDWFGDVNLMEFLKRAEMLKPSTPPPSSNQSENSNLDDVEDYMPNIVFVQNKATRESFQPIAVNAMQQAIHSLMMKSKLRYTGCSSLSRSCVMPSLNAKTLPLDVNLFLLPAFDWDKENTGPTQDSKSPLLNLVPSYQGHPKTHQLIAAFRNQLYAAGRPPLTHAALTEKNWYQYASRSWESLKKSTLMSEYHRLLT